ncbi:MAG: phenylalanine--tRNA ligase subunit beta [Actinomycetota bacterium]|nr:phenylalanine--tRNA ligase subunit beta [Actinomycetota bacterium]
MKVTLNWIKEFLDNYNQNTISPGDIANMLTMSGTEVKKIENTGSKYENIIIGKIVDFTKHPSADKLSLCKVDTGTRIASIVCGAKNFKKGDIVVTALPGAVVNGMTIKENKIRGQISEGMMCSEMELGLSSDSEGIMILDNSFRVGESFSKLAGLDDVVFELEVTPNRPDCLGVIGIAREISALTGIEFKIPEYDLDKRLNIDSNFIIEIEDYNLCPRYTAKIFENITNIQTPLWMRNRLLMCDIRSISLIVDLTNYIMLETGQPLHAFDKDLLHSNKIVVRRAKEGEKIKLIDDSMRILDNDILVIADEKKAVAIAGIMGGKDTEINPDTKNILLEAANFNGPSIMRTSKKIGLRSEASNRFEKKIDPLLTLYAVGRFEDVLNKITGYGIKGCIYDNYKKTERKRNIVLRTDRVVQILGKDIDKNTISRIFTGLKIENRIRDKEIDTIVPSWRYEDLEREIDLIEEIARIYGYDKFDSIPTTVTGRRGKYTGYQKVVREIRQSLCDTGLSEVINYSFYSNDTIKKFKLDLEKEYSDNVEIINPINENFRYLRTTLLPSLLKNVRENINHNIKDIGIFEISKIFKKRSDEDNDILPLEINKIGIILTGKRVQKSWNEEERDTDFYDLKGILEFIYDKYYSNSILKIEESDYKFFHPRINGSIRINGKKMGIIGKIHPLLVMEAEINQDVYYMELNLDDFVNNIRKGKKYKPITSFPAIDIDLAIVVDEEIKNDDIVNEIKKCGSSLLKNVRLFDIYRGPQIEKNKKSMAYSLNFREDSRTLKDIEVEIIVKRILENLGKKFNAKIRE